MYIIILVFFFLISLVHAWITVNLEYHICNQNMTAIINYDAVAGGFYGSTSNVLDFLEIDFSLTEIWRLQFEKHFIVVGLKGCTDDCNVYIPIIFDSNSELNIRPYSRAVYHCESLVNAIKHDFFLTVAMTKEYCGTVPNPKYLPPPSIAYLYCTKGLNIDTGRRLKTQITGVAYCIDALGNFTNPDYDPGVFEDNINIDTSTNLRFHIPQSRPSASTLLFASQNYLSYLHIFKEGVKLAFEDLNPNLMVQQLSPKPAGPDISLIDIILMVSYAIAGIIFTPLAPAVEIGTVEIGFQLQSMISGAFGVYATNLGLQSNDVHTPLAELENLKQNLQDSFLNATQSLSYDVFLNGVNFMVLDGFIRFNSTEITDVTVKDQILPNLNASFASYTLNYYGAVVCDPQSLWICDSRDRKCCEWHSYRNGIECVRHFECNDRIGAPINCVIEGGYENGGNGFSKDTFNNLAHYGNLTDACEIINGEHLNGWNFTVDDCSKYQGC